MSRNRPWAASPYPPPAIRAQQQTAPQAGSRIFFAQPHVHQPRARQAHATPCRGDACEPRRYLFHRHRSARRHLPATPLCTRTSQPPFRTSVLSNVCSKCCTDVRITQPATSNKCLISIRNHVKLNGTTKGASYERCPPLSRRQTPLRPISPTASFRVLRAITTYQNERGFVPSFREIGAAAGLKKPFVGQTSAAKTLEDKGYIRLNANKGRAVEILHDPFSEEPSGGEPCRGRLPTRHGHHHPFPAQNTSEAVLESRDIPLVGRIAAGTPITAEQHIDDVMRLPERLTGSGGNPIHAGGTRRFHDRCRDLQRRFRGGARTAYGGERRYRGGAARRRGDGKRPSARTRATCGLCRTIPPLPHRRHLCHHHGKGCHRPAKVVSLTSTTAQFEAPATRRGFVDPTLTANGTEKQSHLLCRKGQIMAHTHTTSRVEGNQQRLMATLAVTVTVFIIEVVAAFITDSLALLTDAGHMLTDVSVLVASTITAILMRRKPNSTRTWGWARLGSSPPRAVRWSAAVRGHLRAIRGMHATVRRFRSGDQRCSASAVRRHIGAGGEHRLHYHSFLAARRQYEYEGRVP